MIEGRNGDEDKIVKINIKGEYKYENCQTGHRSSPIYCENTEKYIYSKD